MKILLTICIALLLLGCKSTGNWIPQSYNKYYRSHNPYYSNYYYYEFRFTYPNYYYHPHYPTIIRPPYTGKIY